MGQITEYNKPPNDLIVGAQIGLKPKDGYWKPDVANVVHICWQAV